MLVEFRVENFKNFKEELIFTLDQVKKYEFNMNAIRDDIIKTAVIYGKNGSGKSNLGLAIFDISVNLMDNDKNNNYSKGPFFNLMSKDNAKFYYKFKFNSSYLLYKYEKDAPQHIIKEEVIIDDKRVIYYDDKTGEVEVNLKGVETLNIDLYTKNMSLVKYIKSKVVLVEDGVNFVYQQFIYFVENMLILSSLENNHLQDVNSASESITQKIIEKGKLKEFESFLKRAGIDYKLIIKEVEGKKTIFCDFDGNQVNFYDITSSGVKTLILFYYLIELNQVSFVFIDDFDAFYHNKLSKFVIKEILNHKIQCILTTHNTSIIDNDLLRPDCYFNLVDGNIQSFVDSTKKELRKAHNIEKMYRAGSFDG